MQARGSGCQSRSSLAERYDCTKARINQWLVDSYQNTIHKQQVTIKLHLVAGYKTIPLPRSVEKLSFMKALPGAQMVGHRCYRPTAPAMSRFSGAAQGAQKSHWHPWGRKASTGRTSALPYSLPAPVTLSSPLRWEGCRATSGPRWGIPKQRLE